MASDLILVTRLEIVKCKMAAVEPATSMNGNVNFNFGENDNNDDAFEAATLQDEVRFFVLTNFGCANLPQGEGIGV